MPNRSGPYTPKPDYDPPSQKKPSLPRGGTGEISPRVIKAVDDIVDKTERQFWCSVYIEALKDPAVQDGFTGPVWEMADKAVAEYRKRYGAERIG